MPAAKGEKGDEGRRGKKVEGCLILFLNFIGINKQSCLVRYGIKLNQIVPFESRPLCR